MKIIDNFLPQEQFDSLQSIIMSWQFPWFYTEYSSVPPEDRELYKDKMAMETEGFCHMMYDRENSDSFTHKILDDFYHVLANRLGFTKRHLIRTRLSMKFPKIGFTKDHYNIPHVDYYNPHETLIYYLNDSDGDTIIFDEWFNIANPDKSLNGKEEFTVKDRVSPKANRLLWINGLQYHTASNPIESKRRIIININLEPL